MADWTTLQSKTGSYRTLQSLADPDGKVREVVFSGLYVKLSELIDKLASGTGTNLVIFADTVLVDRPSFDAKAAVVVARCLDLSPVLGEALPVRVPAAGDVTRLEIMVQQAVNGTLKLTTSNSKATDPTYTVPVGDNPPKAVYYNVDSDGKSTYQVAGDAATIDDLINRTWAMNSLKASFTAAAWLMDSQKPADRDLAKEMLEWVVATIRVVGAGGTAVPNDLADLYNAAAALLVVLNVAEGAYYVPVLSGDFYGKQLDKLLTAMSRYEGDMNTLGVQTGISEAIQKVSSTLQGVADDSLDPMRTQLDTISANIVSLDQDLAVLRRQFQSQQIEADTRLTILQALIAEQVIWQTMEAAFKMIGNVVKAGAAMTGGADKRDPGAALGALLEAAMQAKKLADLAENISPDRKLLDRAKELATMMEQLMTSYVSALRLWNQGGGTTATQLPETLAAERVDPDLAWDNYMVESESMLTSLKERIGDGTKTGPSQDAANKYLASLKILAQYGKAINAKFVALSQQMAQGTTVRSQIRAAEKTQERWQALANKAQSDQEKLAALRGIIQVRIDSIKRSAYASWTQYRNCFFYLNFQEPPRAINLDMNSAAMTDVFNNVTAWMARLRGDTADGQKVRLPDENVKISFSFPIVKAGQPAPTDSDSALLTPRSGDNPPSISWTIPTGDQQLAGVLPAGGKVAIWITSAQFFLDGVTPNAKGRVMTQISTSGSYQNGFGPLASYSFVNKGLVGNFAYESKGETVYNPWGINTEIYMTPTPFTQWNMLFDADGGDPANATALRMDLTISYRTKP